MTRFVPTSIDELREAVATALAAEEPVELVAGGTKRGLGRPLQTPHVVDLNRLSGILACNLSGPRRIKAGAARDHFLGFRAVSGRAEVFKAGGKVVKNVTGYDLPKLMAGSYGTLAALEEVTVKVLPRPETAATVLIF